jgi:ATP synthase protein I
MAQGEKPPSFDEFDARLERLRGGKAGPPPGTAVQEPQGMRLGAGFQAGVEVIAGVGGGALIGYGLDSWFSTSPLFLIVFFFLGAAAGVLNAYRTLRRFMART